MTWVPAATVLVGDTVSDMRAAKRAGVVSVAWLWGIGSADELVAAGADHVVARPAELGGTLRRLLPTDYTVPTVSAIGGGT